MFPLTNKTIMGICGGAASAIFIGYCIYFDYQRRADPDYKRKIRERRRREANRRKTVHNFGIEEMPMPDSNDTEAMENYFLHQMKLGELMIANERLGDGLDHFVKAMMACSQPIPFMEMLQSTLPPEALQTFVAKLQEISKRHSESEMESGASSETTSSTQTEPVHSAILMPVPEIE